MAVLAGASEKVWLRFSARPKLGLLCDPCKEAVLMLEEAGLAELTTPTTEEPAGLGTAEFGLELYVYGDAGFEPYVGGAYGEAWLDIGLGTGCVVV